MLSIVDFSNFKLPCAVAVGRTDSIITHCGLLYFNHDEGHYYMLHLGSPLHLYNNNESQFKEFYSHFVWREFVDITTSILNLIANKCIIIAKRNKSLPYGLFHDENTCFDANGKLILGPDSSGLTCSHFVKVVLKNSGIDIINAESWPDEREGDLEWVNHLVEIYQGDVEMRSKQRDLLLLERDKSLKAKLTIDINILKGTLDDLKEGQESILIRYRPEEVAGASYISAYNHPLNYENEDPNLSVKELGEQLLASLPNPPIKT